MALFRSKVDNLERLLGVSHFNEEMENKMGYPKIYKGSVYETQTAGFNLDDADDLQNPIGLNSS